MTTRRPGRRKQPAPNVIFGKYGHFGRECFYCGRPADGFDHKIPESRGGLTTARNLVPCCQPCNNRKRHLTVEQYRLYVGLKYERLPVVFHGEELSEPPTSRDWLFVASQKSVPAILRANGL